MSKHKLLLPFTIITGAITAAVGAVVFARNKNVRNFVKKSSVSAFNELKTSLNKLNEKLEENKSKDQFITFAKKTVSELTDRLDKADDKTIEKSIDSFGDKINETLEKLEELKEKNIDPKLDAAIENVKEASKNFRK